MYELACTTKAPKLNLIAFIFLTLLYLLFLSFIYNLSFCYSDLLLFNNTFQLVKVSFFPILQQHIYSSLYISATAFPTPIV